MLKETRMRIPSLTIVLGSIVSLLLVAAQASAQTSESDSKPLRAGMIGLDTSHVNAFTNIINSPDATGNLARVQVVVGYPGGTDIPASRDRVGKFTEDLRNKGIEIVDTIPELLQRVDVVLLESVDGRIHLEEAAQVIKGGKPLFIDKPIGASLSDAIAIFQLAKEHDVPVWSSSSLRFSSTFQSLLNSDEVGEIIGGAAWGPCTYQEGTPDMYFYGIHGIEGLFTLMGTGCESITRVKTENTDLLTGVWDDGRIGTYRGIRRGKAAFGATAFGTRGIKSAGPASAYDILCEEMATFFQTGEPPVSAAETLEIFAFMDAADESKRQGGATVTLKSVMDRAFAEAQEKIARLK